MDMPVDPGQEIIRVEHEDVVVANSTTARGALAIGGGTSGHDDAIALWLLVRCGRALRGASSKHTTEGSGDGEAGNWAMHEGLRSLGVERPLRLGVTEALP